MFSRWSLSDKKYHQVFRTVLSIVAVINKAVVWVVFTCPLISKSSSPFINTLVIALSAPITIGTTVTVMC